MRGRPGPSDGAGETSAEGADGSVLGKRPAVDEPLLAASRFGGGDGASGASGDITGMPRR